MDFKNKIIIQQQGGESEKVLQYSDSSSYPKPSAFFKDLDFLTFNASNLKFSCNSISKCNAN
jgi:hypothetical protein